MIKSLSVNQLGQPVREDGPETHLLKAGTPTMGGALILTAIAAATVLWADLENHYVWIVLFVTLSFGVIGYVDDYKKLVLQDPAGISAKQKLFWQSSAALIAAIALYVTATDEAQTSLLIPYFKDLAIPMSPVTRTSLNTSTFRMWQALARSWFSVLRWRVRDWVSCGSTPTPRRCLWAISERFPWVRRLALWPSLFARRLCWR
jgi:UDP-N-acetylmuramyl pentapeptide phosphotransferase/UDP-N-acetylglucosamine-1-phosphate transferase